jgi:transcriptional regulator with XRE-family HTH domain
MQKGLAFYRNLLYIIYMGRDNNQIGQLIREIRKSRHMTQMKLADLVGVSYQQIQKYEKGASSISVDRLKQLSKALDVTIFTFFPAEKKGSLKESKLAVKMSKEEQVLLENFRKTKAKKARTALFEFSKLIAKNKKLPRQICSLKDSCK